MNQWMYDTIVTIIQNGAPALANQLIGGIQELITNNQAKAKEIEELKGKKEKAEKKEPEKV